jgi:FkbM family methyltransferase
MGISSRIASNIRSYHRLGFGVFSRHLGRLRADKIGKLNPKDVGPVYVRTGESDFGTLHQVFVQLDYSFKRPPQLDARIQARYRHILAQGSRPIIIDAGANIGAASLWFLNQFPEAVVVAIEPEPNNAAILKKNIASRPNAIVMEAAIGATPGKVALSNQSLGWAVQTTRADSGLPVVTVEDAFAAAGGGTPFICKIDIEGFEKDLFSENLDWISKCFAVIIEPHDWMLPGEMTSHNFQKAMAAHPFEMFMLGENLAYVRV